MVGVGEFYSASEAWTALSYSTRERQESEKVEDSERERESSRLELKRETEVADWALGGRERPRGGRRMEAVVLWVRGEVEEEAR